MNSDHYISLIYKELKGLISPEEAKALQEWEAQSTDNQLIAEETRRVWKESEQYELPFDLDLDADFAKMKSSIDSSDSAGKVVTMRPRRLWLRSIAAAAVILMGATFIFQNYFSTNSNSEIVEVTATSGIEELQLADGSKVWLNKGSKLSYPTKFSATERPIQLEGEAFFEVSKDPNRPFTVTTDRTSVTVLGTEFNVRDIANEETFEVAVQEGKVAVQRNASDQKVILVKNEKAVYDPENDLLERKDDKNLNALSWKRKSLKFDDAPLEEILSTLEKHFKVNIELQNKDLLKCSLSGYYKTKDPVKNILEQVADHTNFKVKPVSKTEYILTGGTCK